MFMGGGRAKNRVDPVLGPYGTEAAARRAAVHDQVADGAHAASDSGLWSGGLGWMLFLLLTWPIRRMVRWARYKSFWYFALWAAAAAVDITVPELGGKLTTVFMVLVPPLVLSIWLHFSQQWAGSAMDYVYAALAMLASAAYGLLRAWSAASGVDLPGWQQKLGLVVFGVPASIGASVLSTLSGWEIEGPLPLVHPDGWATQLQLLDPLLVGASVVAILVAFAQLRFAVREFGGGAPPIPLTLKAEARNRLMSPARAAWRLAGVSTRTWRRRWLGPFVPSLRRLSDEEIVLAADLPQPGVRLGLVRLWLGRFLARLGLGLELTIFDPTPLVVTRCTTSAVFVAGSGAGKTHGWYIPMVMLRDAPMVLLDVQRNAAVRDAPLRRALGRTPFVFDANLGDASASANVLAHLDPSSADYFQKVEALTLVVLAEAPDGAHADLRGRARTLFSIFLGSHVPLALHYGDQPRLSEVYQELTAPDMPERLAELAEHGHPAWQAQARQLAKEHLEGDEIAGGLQFFLGEALKWLGDPHMAAIVDGTTDVVADPADVVGDHGRADWLMQPSADEMRSRPAAWRLLIKAVVEPHDQRTEPECEGLPKTLLLIDEAPALGKFDVIDASFVRLRQKGVFAVLMAQAEQQVDLVWGPGQMSTWQATAKVKGWARMTEADFATRVENQFGNTLQLVRERTSSPGGGFGGTVKRWESVPLVSRNQLMNGPEGSCAVIVETRNQRALLLAQMAFWFRHPFLKARMQRARRLFADVPQERPAIEASAMTLEHLAVDQAPTPESNDEGERS